MVTDIVEYINTCTRTHARTHTHIYIYHTWSSFYNSAPVYIYSIYIYIYIFTHTHTHIAQMLQFLEVCTCLQTPLKIISNWGIQLKCKRRSQFNPEWCTDLSHTCLVEVKQRDPSAVYKVQSIFSEEFTSTSLAPRSPKYSCTTQRKSEREISVHMLWDSENTSSAPELFTTKTKRAFFFSEFPLAASASLSI